MPLDGHAFLVNQGWSGAGNGLRNGSISRPISIPQKRTLAGIGKDRDEAFPFWDHLFAVAASAIQIECFSSDDEDGDVATKCVRSSTLDLRQTSTGILSNLPPVVGTPIFSDDITPAACSEAASGSSTPRLSLMALAKREAARRGLYSKFFRGPILGPEVHSETVETEATAVSQTVGEDIRVGTEKRSKNNDLSRDASTEDSNNEAKKQEKLRKKAEKAAKKLRRRKGKQKGEDEQDVDETIMLSAPQEQVSEVLVLETPHEMPEKRKKKNKRRKVASTSELETPPFERTLTEDCKDSKASRKKRRRRDESL
jgi:nucleolar protein TMA23